MTTPAVSAYSTTPANNVQANTGVDWDEGMSPAQVNNSARQNMTDLRNFANDLAWFKYGKGDLDYSPVYVGATQFKIAGADVSSVYHAGRRVRAVGSGTGTIYGTISAVAFSTDTTVTVSWDSGSLSNETLTICISQVPRTGGPSAPNITRQVLTSGSAATYTTPGGVRQLRIRMLGGGAGGSGPTGGVNGGAGSDTIFNSVHAKGGGIGAAGSSGGDGGTGGTGTGTGIVRIAGAPGNAGGKANSTIITSAYGGSGGGQGGGTSTTAGVANTGGGGGGDICSGVSSETSAGPGGGQGEYVEFLINSPSATYAYTVGAGGAGGNAAGAGGSGVIIVDELY